MTRTAALSKTKGIREEEIAVPKPCPETGDKHDWHLVHYSAMLTHPNALGVGSFLCPCGAYRKVEVPK